MQTRILPLLMVMMSVLKGIDVSGQSTGHHLSLNIGVATSSMKDYKNFLKDGAYYFPFEPKTFNDFGPSPFVSYTFTFSRPGGFFFGFGNGLYSTWTRLHYRDYSGEYLLDWQVKGTSIHLKIGGTEQVFKNTNLEFYGKPEFLYSKIQFEEKIVVYDIEQKFPEDYNFWQLMGEAGMDLVFLTNKRINPFASIAYSGLLITSKDEDHDPPNWSGIRASAGVRVSFNKKVLQSKQE